MLDFSEIQLKQISYVESSEMVIAQHRRLVVFPTCALLPVKWEMHFEAVGQVFPTCSNLAFAFRVPTFHADRKPVHRLTAVARKKFAPIAQCCSETPYVSEAFQRSRLVLQRSQERRG